MHRSVHDSGLWPLDICPEIGSSQHRLAIRSAKYRRSQVSATARSWTQLLASRLRLSFARVASSLVLCNCRQGLHDGDASPSRSKASILRKGLRLQIESSTSCWCWQRKQERHHAFVCERSRGHASVERQQSKVQVDGLQRLEQAKEANEEGKGISQEKLLALAGRGWAKRRRLEYSQLRYAKPGNRSPD